MTSLRGVLEERQPCKPADLSSNPSIINYLKSRFLLVPTLQKQKFIEEIEEVYIF